MKSERVTQAWEFYRDNCPGFKEPMRKQFRRLDEYVSVVETENAKLKRAAERDADVMESLNLSLEESQAENAKLRECLQDFADAIKNDDGFGVDQGWMLERMRELGVNEE